MSDLQCSALSADYQLFFVQPVEVDYDDLSKPLKDAFVAMDERGFDPEWISEKECKAILRRDSNKIFICDPFNGCVFDHLMKYKCRIVGPQCLLTCLSTDQPIPRLPNPLYSVALKDVVATCTNMDRQQKNHLTNKLEMLGGIMSKVLVNSVTHLITNDVGSKKYFVAGNMNLPIMLPSWIDECWEKSKNEDFDCNDASSLDQYRCPIFKGCSITVSQISSSERQKISQIITTNGGIYSGNMECHKTTHLILTEATGKKYVSAKKWKMHCVTPLWIYDSIDKGYCLDWSRYYIEDSKVSSASTSTPENNKLPPPHVSTIISALDYSNIENSSIVSRVNETAVTDFEFSMMKASKSSVPEPGVNNRNRGNVSTLNELDEIDLDRVKKMGLFLDGYRIFISGFSGIRLEKLLRIINLGGGTRFSQISENVSHILANDNFRQELLKNVKTEPNVIHVKWLIESCKNGKILPETRYIVRSHDDTVTDAALSPMNVKGKKFQESNRNFDSSTTRKVESIPDDADTDITLLHEDVLSQYVKPGEKNESKIPDDVQLEDISEHGSQEGSNGIFDGKRFIVSEHFPEDLGLVDAIESGGGEVISEDSRCNYVVVPIASKPNCPNCGILVTTAWLEHCVSEEVPVSPSDNVLFEPLPEDIFTLNLFDGCVVTLSLYTGCERECLMEVAEALGATCQEFFFRVAKGDAAANTHLIIPECEGSKFSAAKRWNIPAVTKNWLLDAVRLKRRPDEKYYYVENAEPLPDDYYSAVIHHGGDGALCENQPHNSNVNDVDSVTSGEEAMSTPQRVDTRTEKILEPIPEKVQTPELKDEPCRKSPPQDIEKAKVHKTPVSTRKSRVQELRESNVGTTNNSTSPMNGTPGKYLDLSAMSAAFDSPNVSKREPFINKRTSIESFRDDCDHYLNLALENHAETAAGVPEKSTSTSEYCRLPLSGLTIVVSKKLAKKQGELNNLVSSLGGDYRWAYDKCCTHLVHEGKTSDISRDFKRAKLQGKYIVSPAWLTACKEENHRADESLYPHSYNPKMNLSSQIVSTKCTSPNKGVKSPSSHKSESTTPKKDEVKQTESGIYKQLTDFMSTVKPQSSRRKRKSDNLSTSNEAPEIRSTHRIPSVLPTNENEQNPVESQGIGPITWEDPVGREERAKIAAMIAEQGTQDSQLVETTETKRFILTGFSDQEKMECSESIVSLKGEVLESDSFDQRATHLIASKPSKSEKFLSGIAAGIWILNSTFVDDSRKLGKFAPEEDYEWGGEKMSEKISLPAPLQKIAQSAQRWRSLLKDKSVDKKGAFSGWKIILFATSNEKELRLKRLLKAGLADILNDWPPFVNCAGATHAFIELPKNKAIDIDWSRLVKNNVLCLRMDYIASYLRDGDKVNANDFVLEQAKSCDWSESSGDKRKPDVSNVCSHKRSRQK